MEVKKMDEHMHHGAGKAWMLLIFGILLILNAVLYVVSWIVFAGIIAIIFAIILFIKSACCKGKKK